MQHTIRTSSELLDTVLEGPDQLDQVLSAHLAQVDCASLLREPGLLRLTLLVFFFSLSRLKVC